MKLDTPNRSILALLALPYVLLGLLNGGLLALVARRLASGGLGALDDGGLDLRPALAVFALLAAGMARAGWSLVQQVRASRRLTERVRSLQVELPGHLGAAAARAGLGGRVDLMAESEPLAFTYGLFAPRVALSRSLVSALSGDELTAVLEHEAYHVHNLDPLKIMLARAMAPAFFYLPALSPLRDRYVLGRELVADRWALRSCSRRSLAGALYRIAPSSDCPQLAPSADLAGTEMLEARVVQLETGEPPVLPRVSRWSLAVTTLAVGVLCATVLLRSIGVVAEACRVCPVVWASFGWVGFRRLFRAAAPEVTGLAP
jgi:Zn-dependent protease with chaperone function